MYPYTGNTCVPNLVVSMAAPGGKTLALVISALSQTEHSNG